MRSADYIFTPGEVACLASTSVCAASNGMAPDMAISATVTASHPHVSVNAVNKAIEDKIFPVRLASTTLSSRQRRMLPSAAVWYLTVAHAINVPLPNTKKKDLFRWILDANVDDDEWSGIFEMGPIVKLDVRDWLFTTFDIVERYREARDNYIVSDPAIMGGAPVIKGTRMTVYSLFGRVEHGDSLAEIAEENSDIPMKALEAAVAYARANPLLGRPGKRPWR